MNPFGSLSQTVSQAQESGLNQFTQFALETPKGPSKPTTVEGKSLLMAAVGQQIREDSFRGITTRATKVHSQPSDRYQALKLQFISELNQWIDELLRKNRGKRVSCVSLPPELRNYFPLDFLRRSYFVPVDQLPRPDTDALKKFGEVFAHPNLFGITYKNTYFITASAVHKLDAHFHELVHVYQWEALGGMEFLTRYIAEIQQHGYFDAPLEASNYALGQKFARREEIPNLLEQIQQ